MSAERNGSLRHWKTLGQAGWIEEPGTVFGILLYDANKDAHFKDILVAFACGAFLFCEEKKRKG